MLGLFKKKPDISLEPFMANGFRLTNNELAGSPVSPSKRQALDLFNRGIQTAQSGKFRDAYKLFSDSANAQPSVASLLNALLLTAAGGFEKETLDLIGRTKEVSDATAVPYPAFCHFYMAMALLKVNGPTLVAMPILDLALTAAREQQLALTKRIQSQRADLLLSLQRPAEALVAINEVLGNSSLVENTNAAILKAAIVGELGDYAAELAIYDVLDAARTKQGQAPDPHLLCNRAIALWRTGKLDEALGCFDRAQLQLAALGQPKDQTIEMNRALVFISQQKYVEARDTLLAARDLNAKAGQPPVAQLELNLSSAYAYLGEYAKQLDHVLLGEAARKSAGLPPDPRYFDSRADALIALGRIDEAWAVYDEAEKRYAELGVEVPPVLYKYGKHRAEDLGATDKVVEFELKLSD